MTRLREIGGARVAPGPTAISPGAASYYRARYYDPGSGRFLSEDSIRFEAGLNFYNYAGNTVTLWTDPYGYQTQKCKKSCGLSRPPAYNVSRTVPGGTSFSWNAQFMNDDAHDPKCCEVRQYVSWDHGGPPNNLPFPKNAGPNRWYEDRDANGVRFGRRTGEFAQPPGTPDLSNIYIGNSYYGWDKPSTTYHVKLRFRLKVVDVCNGGSVIYTSKTLTEVF